MSNWTIPMVKYLIKKYKEHPSLWKTTHIDYKNKDLQTKSLKEIVKSIKNKYPSLEVTEKQIKTKWNSLKTEYHKDLKKIKTSKAEGRTYKPKWFHEELAFLTVTSLTVKTDIKIDTMGKQENSPKIIKKGEDKRKQLQITAKQMGTSRKNKCSEKSTSQKLNLKNTSASTSKDEFTRFGEQVASKLRKTTTETKQTELKCKIYNMLFDADMDSSSE